MNQQQVKDILLQLNPNIPGVDMHTVPDFEVIFTGKSSAKVDGLYKSDTMHIIIHNKNHATDNQLLYTALHEYAHHIHFTAYVIPVNTRAHSHPFWVIFHLLLEDAEKKGLYKNIFTTDREFKNLIKRIKSDFLEDQAHKLKELGRIIHEAYELCRKKHVELDDFLDRGLGLHRNTAKSLLKFVALDLNPQVGFDNMKRLAGIKDETNRMEAERAFLSGKSPDLIKAEYSDKSLPQTREDYLLQERTRLYASIEKQHDRIMQINQMLQELGIS